MGQGYLVKISTYQRDPNLFYVVADRLDHIIHLNLKIISFDVSSMPESQKESIALS